MVIGSEPDAKGRVSFTMYWTSDGAVKHRGQCFFAVPTDRIKRGAVVVKDDATAKALAWR